MGVGEWVEEGCNARALAKGGRGGGGNYREFRVRLQSAVNYQSEIFYAERNPFNSCL